MKNENFGKFLDVMKPHFNRKKLNKKFKLA